MTSPTDSSANLDEMDFAILSLLQRDGRISFTDIAKRLDVSVNTVRYRVTKMIEADTLHFYAFVDPLHLSFSAISEIQISVLPSKLIEKVAHAIAAIEETSFVAMITGDADLLVEVNCQDTHHLRDVLDQLHQIEGVVKTKTCTYLKVFKWYQPDLGKIRKRRAKLISVDDSNVSASHIRNR